VVFVPSSKAYTKKVRGLLPETVPHADAAANAARTALLSLALTQTPSLLFEATRDYLHQGYRASAMPRSAALVASLREAGVPAVISGAGPTVLAFAGPQSVAQVSDTQARGWDVHVLPVERTGAAVVPL
jgi:homoserine kinase